MQSTISTLPNRTFQQSLAFREKFHDLIPGGSHTYSKGDDQWPEFAAPYIVKGKGCHVWDVDGNEYIEYGMGLRSVTLGHAYPSVLEAVQKQLPLGSNFNRPAMIELACAERFLELIPGADMVKFAKNGSDATTAAVKLARAYTGRDHVAMCKDHPFFSVDDWFIGQTAINAGIPEAVKSLSLGFAYNSIESFQQLLDAYPQKIACVILEIERATPPAPDFLQQLRELCTKEGVVLVFDEIVTGFRWHKGGAQTLYGVTPDLSTFGKAMGNGFAISALAGKREFMDRGGIRHEHERVFLLSTTNGAETHALAACMACMEVYDSEPVTEHLHAQGQKLRQGLMMAIADHGLQGYVELFGRDCCLFFGTRDAENVRSQPFRTLFLQECVKRGVLAPSLITSYSHQDEDIRATIEVIHEALRVYKHALEEGVEHYLDGKSVKPVYRKRN